MRRMTAALALALAGGSAQAGLPVSQPVNPADSPVVFSDPLYGGPRPDELRRLEHGGMSTFTARWLREVGQTIVLYSRAGEGEFIDRQATPAEVRERFIPPGGSGRALGGGSTLGAGRPYAFERYEMTLSGRSYGCFVATSVTSGDVVLVNLCRAAGGPPADAEVAAALARLRVAPGAARVGAGGGRRI